MICLIALIIIRKIQRQVNKYTIKTNANGLTWHNELSANRIQKALNKFRADIFQNDLYRLTDTDYEDLNLIIKAFGMKIPNKPTNFGLNYFSFIFCLSKPSVIKQKNKITNLHCFCLVRNLEFLNIIFLVHHDMEQ